MVSRVTLMKKGQWAVLQGMWHVAPSAFYEHIQFDIDNAADKGHQIFIEGVGTRGIPGPKSFNERLIRLFWRYWFSTYATNADLKKWQLENESLTYPESVILADIDLAEVARILDESGFSCKLPVGLLFCFAHPLDRLGLLDILESGLDMVEGKKVVPQSKGEAVLMKLLQPYGQKLYPIMITHRNMVAMNTIRRHDTGRDIFVTYGNAHIPGLINLFLLDGWAVESTREIDPEMVDRPIIISPEMLELPRMEGAEVEVETEDETV